MRNRIFQLTASIAAFALLVESCSVKESRWPCPCYLVFEPQESALPQKQGCFLLSVYDDGASAREELRCDILWSSILSDDSSVKVSKGDKLISILDGLQGGTISEDNFLIAEGCQCDSIYACCSRVQCHGELAYVPVYSHKQFATVFLKMENGEQPYYPYSLAVVGSVDGFNLLSLEPHSGNFRYTCDPYLGENEFRFRIPRQADASMALELWDKSAEQPDAPLESIPLGGYILESGYDWQADSLPDIYLGVDYARAELTININDWETVIKLTERI